MSATTNIILPTICSIMQLRYYFNRFLELPAFKHHKMIKEEKSFNWVLCFSRNHYGCWLIGFQIIARSMRSLKSLRLMSIVNPPNSSLTGSASFMKRFLWDFNQLPVWDAKKCHQDTHELLPIVTLLLFPFWLEASVESWVP